MRASFTGLAHLAFGTRMRKEETGATGLEPATSGVTGRRSNQLSYAPERTRMGQMGAAQGQI